MELTQIDGRIAQRYYQISSYPQHFPFIIEILVRTIQSAIVTLKGGPDDLESLETKCFNHNAYSTDW